MKKIFSGGTFRLLSLGERVRLYLRRTDGQFLLLSRQLLEIDPSGPLPFSGANKSVYAAFLISPDGSSRTPVLVKCAPASLAARNLIHFLSRQDLINTESAILSDLPISFPTITAPTIFEQFLLPLEYAPGKFINQIFSIESYHPGNDFHSTLNILLSELSDEHNAMLYGKDYSVLDLLRTIFKKVLLLLKQLHDSRIAHMDFNLRNCLLSTSPSGDGTDLTPIIIDLSTAMHCNPWGVLNCFEGSTETMSPQFAALALFKKYPQLFKNQGGEALLLQCHNRLRGFLVNDTVQYDLRADDIYAFGIELYTYLSGGIELQYQEDPQNPKNTILSYINAAFETARHRPQFSSMEKLSGPVSHLEDAELDALDALFDRLFASNPHHRPSVDQILADPFFTDGNYIPDSTLSAVLDRVHKEVDLDEVCRVPDFFRTHYAEENVIASGA